MVVRTAAAPPTPWSKDLAEPQIDPSAYVHNSALLIGRVTVGANVMIAPGSSVRADEGSPFYIGAGTNLQDGVVIHGLDKGKVIGDDDQEYSVWIGRQSCITHMVMIHGPAYVGDDCFIGFRSTVFNARIGDGCIVMMHALIQDVEIPPGRYVPSGAVITNQQQADRLQEVQEEDRNFVQHVVEVNEALRAGYQCAENNACIAPIKQQNRSLKAASNGDKKSVENMVLDREVVGQVRSLLKQGHKIGVEHANKRRFRTKSWQTAASLESSSEGQVLSNLEALLSEYQGEYVRIIGIDPEQKRRVLETIIQRPEDALSSNGNGRSSSRTKKSYRSSRKASTSAKKKVANSGGSLDGETVENVRSLLAQGCKIGVEHASERRFRTKSWQTATAIDSQQESEVFQELENLLSEYQGEYVRLIGIDPEQKRRVSQFIVQRPGDQVNGSNGSSSSKQESYYRTYNTRSKGRSTEVTSSQTSFDQETISKVKSLLSQGYKIGTEHADKRRFRTKSWQSCTPIENANPAEAIEILEACCAEHEGEYVRMFGIDPKEKRRIDQTIIQRPGEKRVDPVVDNPPRYDSVTSKTRERWSKSDTSLDSETVENVRSLLSQGYKIGTEHANKRRFRTKSWQSCSPIDSTKETEVLTALEACCAEHEGEYVRMFGIDPQEKRRVSQTIIQRP